MSTASEKAFADAALIFEHGVDAAPVSPRALPLVINALDWGAKHPRPTLSRRESQQMGGWGPTRQIGLEKSGELDSFLDGVMRRISTASFCRRLIAAALLSHPVDGAERRARQPAGRYGQPGQPRRRKPTENELAGLTKGNERRRQEAQRRRGEAKATVRV